MPDNPYHGLKKETTEGTPVQPSAMESRWHSDDRGAMPRQSWLLRLFRRRARRAVLIKGSNDRFVMASVEYAGRMYEGLLHAVEEDEEE